MGKIWEEHSKEELILHYNKILWCNKEKIHALGRIGEKDDMQGKMYILPQYMSEKRFLEHIYDGNCEALVTIVNIWYKRYGKDPIPPAELIIMAEEEFYMREFGFDAYKQIRVIGEEVKERTFLKK